VGLVASRKRGAAIRGLLEDSGVAGTMAIRVPAGLDLGAHTAPEVALSILAEIVKAPAPRQARCDLAPAIPAPAAGDPEPAPRLAEPASGIDPVCGMRVEIAGARHTATLDGVEYYFCGAGCRARFVKDPQAFLQPHV
jgi:xanthine dehydrogenase accessory factor